MTADDLHSLAEKDRRRCQPAVGGLDVLGECRRTPLATTGTAEVNGQSIETTTVVTEWDVKQDIVAPL